MNQVQPLVSIILPTYNRADWLPKSIGSVLAQTYRNWELLIIDDGSIDKTANVIRELVDPRISCEKLAKNYGVGYARSIGISAVQGSFVAFIDSDDVWENDKLKIQVKAFSDFRATDIIFGNYLNNNLITGTNGIGFLQTRLGLNKLRTTYHKEKFYEVIGGLPEGILTKNFIATPSVMVKQTIFDEIGSFNSNLRGGEDFEFWWRAALNGAKFGYIDKILFVRNKGEDSLSSKSQYFSKELLQTYDLCENSALALKRSDLLPGLRNARRSLWCSLIREYARKGNRNDALNAFNQSLSYGFSALPFLYLLSALTGPKIVNCCSEFLKK